MRSSFDVGLGGYKWIDSARGMGCILIRLRLCLCCVLGLCVSLSEVERRAD